MASELLRHPLLALVLLASLSFGGCSGGEEDNRDPSDGGNAVGGDGFVSDGAGGTTVGAGGETPGSGGDTLGVGGGLGAGGAGAGNGGTPEFTTGGDSAAGGDGGLPGSGGTEAGDGGGSPGSGGAELSSGGDTAVGGDAGSGGAGSGGAGECDNSFTPTSCSESWPEGQASAEEEILALVNAARASGVSCGSTAMPPVPALSMDETLRCAARAHSQDMMDRDYFSHGTWNPNACECSSDQECGGGMMCAGETTSSSPMLCGKAPALRVQEVGGPAGAGWENIAAGNSTAQATMNQWLDSEGHCKNIMSGAVTTIGVGYASGGGTYTHYWTQNFND